ncbi:MAG: hypothetical protein ACYDIC_12825 [Desulfobaccales bacterium]
MLKIVKFMVVGGIAFWLTTPSLDGGGWESFLIVFGVLSLMVNRPPSEMEPLDSVQPITIALADEEEDNRLRAQTLKFDQECFERSLSEGNHKNPFGDPFYPSD